MNQNFYLKRLLELKDNFSVKVIAGACGVGKSTLLKAFAEHLSAEGVDHAEIIHITCAADGRLKSYRDLYGLVAERTADLERFFLLVDDVDRVAESEKTINALFAGEPAEIYVTTSSGVLVEKISALLPDNCDVLKIYPPPFDGTEDDLQRYLRFGSLPVTSGVDENILPRILRGAAYEMLFDIAEKNPAVDAGLIRVAASFLAQSVGKPVNFKGAGENNLRKLKLSLHAVTDSGLFVKVPRLDVKSGNVLGGGDKFYCVDNGILRALAPTIDEAATIENAVCVELLRRGFEVFSGKCGAMNITFAATRGNGTIFIQVFSDMSVRRATRPLRALPDDAETLLIARNLVKSFGDVKAVTLRDFLLNV